MTGERLQILFSFLQEKKIISTKKDFCEMLGIDYGSLGKYFSGKVNVVINEMNYYKYKNAGINIDWLLTGEGAMFQQEKDLAHQEARKIPVLRQQVSCGAGKNWEEEEVIDGYIEPLNLLPSMRNKKIYAFKASGTSMVGAGIFDGDIILFDPQADPVSDDLYVFALDGNVYCKLLKFDDISRKLHIFSLHREKLADAELLKTLDLTDSGVLDNFHLFGRVLGWLRENRLIRN